MKNETFLGFPNSEFEKASLVVLPVAFDSTSTWKKGSSKGPEAIIESSREIELYDLDLNYNPVEKMNIFTLVVGEKHLKEVEEVVDYMADGIINLSFQPIDNPLKYKNLIHVRKMRGTNHAKDIMSMEISRNGITVFKIE